MFSSKQVDPPTDGLGLAQFRERLWTLLYILAIRTIQNNHQERLR